MIHRALRFLCGLTIAGAVAGQEPARPQQHQSAGVVEGTVTDARTGAPIAKARIGSSTPGKSPTTIADENGHYTLSGLSPGNLAVFAFAEGYGNHVNAVLHSVTLPPGAATVHLDFHLRKEATLAGKVVDSLRKPLPNWRVQLWVRGFRDGRPEFRTRASARTDDRGMFRVAGLREGLYFVAADPPVVRPRKPAPAAPPARENRTPPEPVYVNAKSFFGGGFSPDSATALYLRSGEENESTDIAVPRAAAYCVSATMLNRQSGGAEVTVTLAQSATGWSDTLAYGAVRAGERFEICGVPPGEYQLLAWSNSSAGVVGAFSRHALSIGRRDLEMGELPLDPGVEIRGRVSVASQKRDEQPPGPVALGLMPCCRMPFQTEKMQTVSGTQGEFVFAGLMMDSFWLRFPGLLPAGCYLQDVKQAGISLGTLSIQAGKGDVEVVLGSDSATLSGSVMDDQGHPAPDCSVWLAPKDAPLLLPIRGRTDSNGQFLIQSGLRPGDYLALALCGALDEEQAQDPAFVRGYLNRATEVSLAPKAQTTLALKPTQVQP